MIDEIFVFDSVVHLHAMSDADLVPGPVGARHARDLMVSIGNTLRPVHGVQTDWAGRTSVQEMHDLVFVRSPVDMAMAQTVPVFDWFTDFWAPISLNHAFANAYPERVLFCGGVDPMYRGLDFALASMDVQVRELGATSFKFYNGHLEERTWRCDDTRLAYPMYERAGELDIKVLQFHKGNPFGRQNVEDNRPNDLQKAMRDFPDLTFVVHHLAMPYFDELLHIASRFPNCVLSLSVFANFIPIAPRLVQEKLGALLMHVGSDRLVWGSEAALAGPPAPYLDAFLALEIPEDLRSGFGFPQLTRADKRLILGENFARLMGIDIDAKKHELGLVPRG